MARDFANKNRRKTTAAPSPWRWLLIGLLIGFGSAIVLYYKLTNANLAEQHSWFSRSHNKVAQPTTKPNSNDTTTNKSNTDKLHFDFYTVLPKMQVASGSKASPKLELPETATTAAPNTTSATAPATPAPTKPSEPANGAAIKQIEQSLLAPHSTERAKASSSAAKVPDNEIISASPHADSASNAVSTTAASTSELSNTTEATTVAKSNPTEQIIQVGSFQKFSAADELRAQLTMLGLDAHIKSVKEHGVNWKKVWLGPFNATDLTKIQKQLQENGLTGTIKPYSP